MSSADRFTVDPDEWVTAPARPPAAPESSAGEEQTTPRRLFARRPPGRAEPARLHHSVDSLLHNVASGSVVVYLLAVPLYAGLAAAANNRRPGFHTAPVVRLPDTVIGSLMCVAAHGATTLLGPGLSGVYGLWRIDLLMVWLFLLGATVASFGRRQVVRSWSVWVVLPDGWVIVVDGISTPRPQALELYRRDDLPDGTLASTPDAEVDLGHGVVGQLFRAEDSRHGIVYTLLTFSWRLPVDISITGGLTGPPAQLAQRITLIAVDNHQHGAPFPEPGNATLDRIRAVFPPAWSSQGTRANPVLRADEQLLDDTARALVHQRLTGG